MRMIAGPRQVGKTTLARNFLQSQGCEDLYYNWDRREIRQRFKADPYFYHADVLSHHSEKKDGKLWICFDEIHKVSRWKDLLKDAFDSFEERYQFIVTGSARLDLFKKAGDSLSGRYFLFRLLPISLSEMTGQSFRAPGEDPLKFVEESIANPSRSSDLDHLIRFGGFPEPLTKGDEVFSAHWREEYVDSLLKEDLRDLSQIHDLENVATLMTFLPARVGAPLSVNALKEEMQVSYNAVKNYLQALVLTYILFRIPPYSRKISRSIKKENKAYFFDWTQVSDESKRFENYVAVELKNRVELWSAMGDQKFELYFVRSQDGRETDFLVTRNQKPYFLVEAKLSADTLASHHYRHAEVLGKIPFIQLTKNETPVKASPGGIFVLPAARFL